mmetsp:Transcript_28277/g.57391  ORF Transcript_28277/g.57391 Transcript_28277/m.57391 type:complete len:157 (+) Transcript_28277:15-485(+)
MLHAKVLAAAQLAERSLAATQSNRMCVSRVVDDWSSSLGTSTNLKCQASTGVHGSFFSCSLLLPSTSKSHLPPCLPSSSRGPAGRRPGAQPVQEAKIQPPSQASVTLPSCPAVTAMDIVSADPAALHTAIEESETHIEASQLVPPPLRARVRAQPA